MEAKTYPCQYFGVGCMAVTLSREKLNHEELCIYRMCQCPSPIKKCEWEGRIIQLAHHLTTFHRLTILQGETVVFSATNICTGGETHCVTLQSCFESHFMLVLTKRQVDQGFIGFFAVAQLLGSRKRADSFNCRMELVKRGRRLDWEGKPRCVFDTDVMVPDHANDCFIFDNDAALIFAENQTLNITVTITESE